jgi:replicative DNA helicase
MAKDNESNFQQLKKPASFQADMQGRIFPQAVPLEEAVLGALMVDRDAVANVLDVLKPASFYLDAHKTIYECILTLFRDGKPIDLLTVIEQLKRIGELEKVGGYSYIAELTNKVASAANLEFHARIVAQKYIQRELIHVSTQIAKEAFEDSADPIAMLDDAERRLYSVTETLLSRSYESFNALSGQFMRQLEAAAERKDGLTGVPSGFADLDRFTMGWQKSDLIIIAARPAMGKTALVLGLARNAAVDFSKPVVVFSLEMSKLQLVQRLVSLEAEIEGSKFRSGKLEPYEYNKLNEAIDRLSKGSILIDDTAGINIFELRAKCRRLKQQHDIQMVVIDYLQLMTGSESKNSNREQEISNISRALKALAKELNVPVIALSQLSRAVESRGGNKKPQLSDLRESGAIEQDADQVMFIYRPEYYQIEEDDSGNSTKGLAELIFAKNRHGSTDTVKLRFIGQFTKFTDYTADDIFGLSNNGIPETASLSSDGGSYIIKARSEDSDLGNLNDVPF